MTANNEQRTIHHLFFFAALWHAVLYIGRVVGKVQTSATGAVLWGGKLERGMNLLLWWGESVLHWCNYNLYLVSVPGSKPTLARITFSTVCYTGSDIRTGWGLGTRLPIPEALMRLSVLFMSAQLSNWVIECNNSEATNEWLSLHYGSNWFIMQTSNFTACSS